MSLNRFPKMDRILRRRQIGARPFLRPAQWFIFHNWNSNSIRFGTGERGKCDEFDVWDIQGTANGNFFFLVHGTCRFSSFNIFRLFKIWSLSERGSYRFGFGLRGKHRRWSKQSVYAPVDAEFEKRRSSLGGDLLHNNRGVFVWR